MSTRFSLTYLESLTSNWPFRTDQEPVNQCATVFFDVVNQKPRARRHKIRISAPDRGIMPPRTYRNGDRASAGSSRTPLPRTVPILLRFFLSSPEPHSRQIPDGSPRSPPPQTTPASTKIGSAPLASLCAPMVCPRPRRSPSTRTIKPVPTYQHPRHGSPSRTTASRS